jgi:glutamate dehydrogenase
VRHVLYDSFLQAQILAEEVRGSAGRMYAYEDLMAALEADGLLDREIERLPGSEEMAERRRAGRGMERPELAVLLAYAKRSITGALLRAGLPDDPFLDRALRSYFPARVVARFGDLLADHPLRSELVATIVSNRVVNDLGSTFVSRLEAELGEEPADVVRAYALAREVTDAARRWEAIEALDRSVDRTAVWELMAGVDWLVEATTRWYLNHEVRGPLEPAIETGRAGFRRLAAVVPELVADGWGDERERIAADLAERGVPEAMARAHAYQRTLVHAPDVIAAAGGAPGGAARSVEEVAGGFFRMGEALEIGWIERNIDELPVGTRMQRWAMQALRDDVLRARRELVTRALQEAPDAGVEEAVDRFLAARESGRARLRAFTRTLAGDGEPDLAGLTLAVRQLRALVD